MKKRKTLYLIDGSSYIFRAFYAIKQNLSTSTGLPTNALYGFVNMLLKVVREEHPDYLAVTFDTRAKTFRHEMYGEYKANRDSPPEELAAQFPYFRPLVEAFNIPCLSREGYEADDLIGTLARQGEKHGLDVVIVSGDKDMMQLIGPHVKMLDTMKNKRYGEEEVREKFGVPPELVIDVMGLMGDSSDNIPGVPGVGPKTAAELIGTYGGLEDLYRRIDEVDKKKLREKLLASRDDAFLSRKLATIVTDVELGCGIDDLAVREGNAERVRQIFSQLEFDSLLKEMGQSGEAAATAEATQPAGGKKYHAVLDDEALDRLVDELQRAGSFAVDLETDNKRSIRASMVGISFCWRTHEAFYIPVAHSGLDSSRQLEKRKVIQRLKPLLESSSLKKIGHNIKYDLIVLRNEGIDLRGVEFDTMIASYILDPSRRNHGMDDLAQDLLGYRTLTYQEVVGKGAKEIGFDQVDIDLATRYAAEDADVTWQLAACLRPRLGGEMSALFRELEMPLVEVLAGMEMHGVRVNCEHLSRLAVELNRELQKSEVEIYELAGDKFSINSPKQIGVILFEKLKLPPLKKTKTGYSTDMSVLEELASRHEHPLPEKLISYRQLDKLKSTYVDTLPEEIYPRTGRIHTSFNQTIAATGRLSSSDPNLQNIPVRGALGREIRKAFVAESGCLLLSADYSQIELRILAHLSGDPALISAFKKGEDVHTRTAAEIFGLSPENVDEERRRMAKAVNFGIIYGLSAFGLSRSLKISPKEAKAFIDSYFALYSRVRDFITETIDAARKCGYTTTLFHRRRYLPDLNSNNRQVQQAAERVAINSPVQGSAADIIKSAMLKIWKKIHDGKLAGKMILQVHDELLFECPEHERKALENLVRGEMEGVMPLKVPLVVDVGWGKDWSEAH